MTLLVADDDGRSMPSVLAADAVIVGSTAVSDTVVTDDPDVVVVDGSSVADPRDVVESVREASSDAAVVFVGDADCDADVTCENTETAILAAIERAERVADYRRSVSSLYESCRERALGRPNDEVRAQRREAEDRFAALPEDEETFAALLRSESDGADSAGDATERPPDEPSDDPPEELPDDPPDETAEDSPEDEDG